MFLVYHHPIDDHLEATFAAEGVVQEIRLNLNVFFAIFLLSQQLPHRCHELVNHLEESVLDFDAVLGLDVVLHVLVQVPVDVHSHLYCVLFVDLKMRKALGKGLVSVLHLF